jgi:hypothetical protein
MDNVVNQGDTDAVDEYIAEELVEHDPMPGMEAALCGAKGLIDARLASPQVVPLPPPGRTPLIRRGVARGCGIVTPDPSPAGVYYPPSPPTADSRQ